jgi:hypothetical protein
MARTNNFKNFATDVADSIRSMTGKTGKIPASQFDTEIKSIETKEDLDEELNTYNTEVTEQGVSINTIINLLDGKAIGSGSTDDNIQSNIFVQEDEPENKTGLWIKSSSLYNNVDFIDSGENFSWERTTSITAVRETTTALVGDTIYYFGGLVSGGNATNHVSTIDTKTDNCMPMVSTMTYAAYGITAVAHGTDIYLFGGRNASAYYNYARKFDTLTKKFTTLTALPYNVGQIASAIIGTDIYLFGGAISSGQTTNVYKYNILSNSYTQLTSLPSKRNCATVCAYGTDIYVFGGHDGTSLSDAYKYDTLTNTYTRIADLPQGLWGAGIQLINNKFYIFGGVNNATGKISNITYIYNPVTNEYSTTAKMYFSAGRIQSASVFVNDNIYVCGGQGAFSVDASTLLTPEFIPYVQKGIFTNSLDSYTNTANTIVIDCSINGINVELYKMYNKSIRCNIDNVLCYSAGIGFDKTIPVYYGNGKEWLSLNTPTSVNKEYIEDGMIAWFDGEDVPNADNHWINRLGTDYIYELNGKDLIHSENKYSNNTSLIMSTSADYLKKGYTIEIVGIVNNKTNSNATNGGWLFTMNETGSWGLGVTNDEGRISFVNNAERTDEKSFINYYNKAFTGSLYLENISDRGVKNNDSAKASVNGCNWYSIVETQGEGNLNLGNHGVLCYYARTSGSPYSINGSIYCIRIYNRQLTNEELAHNYAIDKIRFNIDEAEG